MEAVMTRTEGVGCSADGCGAEAVVNGRQAWCAEHAGLRVANERDDAHASQAWAATTLDGLGDILDLTDPKIGYAAATEIRAVVSNVIEDVAASIRSAITTLRGQEVRS